MTNPISRDILAGAEREIALSERLLEVTHVAKRLSVSPQYVRGLIRSQRLVGLRLSPGGTWRVTPSALAAYLSACAEPLSAQKSKHTHT